MNPFQILVNNTPVQIGAPLPGKITHFKLTCVMPVPVAKGQAPLIKQWLNTLVDRLDCEYIEYNNVLVKVNEIKRFKL